MARGFVYRVKVGDLSPAPEVTVTAGKDGGLSLRLLNVNGLDTLPATHGGISTCRTIVEHRSDRATVKLSLAIPNPRAPCMMLPSHATLTFGDVNLQEVRASRLAGKDAALRAKVAAKFGTITRE